jgi:Fur family transcriptional regulator, zinc uptake regulator
MATEFARVGGNVGCFLLRCNIKIGRFVTFSRSPYAIRYTASAPIKAYERRKFGGYDDQGMTKMPRAIFPAPDHDHRRCTSAAIAHAVAQCTARAQRLTPMRRQVLQTLLASHKPLGAYEIIDRMASKSRPAPNTIYRALEFLCENGLVHRIESRNAFVACVHNHGGGDLVVFLICDRCGTVGEAPGGGITNALKASARAAGFLPKSPLIEIAGICAHCRD